MKDKGTSKGKSRKPESSEVKPVEGAEKKISAKGNGRSHISGYTPFHFLIKYFKIQVSQVSSI
jgi:hypothetical protein